MNTTEDPLERALEARRFRRKDVAKFLDERTIPEVISHIGEPDRRVTEYAEPAGNWKPGDGRPVFADEVAAVMAAIGRCAAERLRRPGDALTGLSFHPRPCGWCEFDVTGKDGLLQALDWFTWWSRFVIRESLIWDGAGKAKYSRSQPTGYYANPRVAEFAALSREEQTRRVEHVAKLEVAS